MTEGEEAFARAAYDLLADVERSLGLRVEMKVFLSTRKGVLVFMLMARRRETHPVSDPVVKLTHDWPNAHAVSMGASLFQQANTFAQMCESWSLDQKRQGGLA